MKNEGISISLRRRNILLCVCRAACEHFWFSKPIFRHEQAKARGRRQNMREIMYSGLKHSSCSQLVNEGGLSLNEVQILTDHARLDSVKRYAKVEVARKLDLMKKAQVIRLQRSGTIGDCKQKTKTK